MDSTLKIVIGAVVGAIFLVLLFLERRFSLRPAKRPAAARLAVNLGVSILALAAGGLVVGPVALRLSAHAAETHFGLLHLMPLPVAAEFVVGFLLMDLSFYYWHRVNHVVPLFWRFHNVHHIDPDLDVSTSFRFHFGEVLYSVFFRMAQVYLLGITVLTFLVYELVFQCATLFHHSNVRLPIRLERALNKVIVTPRMHGIHHSIVRDETNSNYSVVFRWWDLLHGTLRVNVKQSDVIIGVPGYMNPQDNRFLNLLSLPFRKQREYWRLPDGTRPTRFDAQQSNVGLGL